jgi:hypothetical protein
MQKLGQKVVGEKFERSCVGGRDDVSGDGVESA